MTHLHLHEDLVETLNNAIQNFREGSLEARTLDRHHAATNLFLASIAQTNLIIAAEAVHRADSREKR